VLSASNSVALNSPSSAAQELLTHSLSSVLSAANFMALNSPPCAAQELLTLSLTHCLLCSSADLADSRRSFVKSRHASAAGFVDLSHQHSPHDKVATNFTLLDGLL